MPPGGPPAILPRGPFARYANGVSDRSDAIERAVAAYRALAELAETVEDEWQYVTDLTDADLPNLESLADGPELSAAVVGAIDEAVAETALITDPNRAVDWLSTFPHIVGLAVGGDVDAPPEGSTSETDGGDEGPDDDNPFRLLLGGGR